MYFLITLADGILRGETPKYGIVKNVPDVKLSQFQNIKAIGFDVDGTLYRMPTEMSVKMGQDIIKWASKKLGRDEDEFAEEYVARREKYRSNTITLNSFGLSGEEIFQQSFDDFPIEEHVGRDAKLIGLIANLKKKYKLFIITNGAERQVVRKFEAIGIDPADFDPKVYCYDMGWVKPDPAPFLYALEQLKMEPQEVVYVGDRDDLDIQASQAVGMKAVRVGGMSEYAEASVESIYELEKLFK